MSTRDGFCRRVSDGLAKGLDAGTALSNAIAYDRAMLFKRAVRDALRKGLTGGAALKRGLEVSEATLYRSKKSEKIDVSGGPMTNGVEFREK